MVPDELYALLASIHAVTCMAVSESYRSSNFNVIGDDGYGKNDFIYILTRQITTQNHLN